MSNKVDDGHDTSSDSTSFETSHNGVYNTFVVKRPEGCPKKKANTANLYLWMAVILTHLPSMMSVFIVIILDTNIHRKPKMN